MRYLSACTVMMTIWASSSIACAQEAPKACNSECLLQKVDALEQKVGALQSTIDRMTTQINSTIKSGQNVTLHTQNGRPGGCLTYVGPSGDQGGIVSWNVNCSHDTLWTIN